MSVAILPAPDSTPNPEMAARLAKLERARESYRLLVAQWGMGSLEAEIAQLAVNRAERALARGEA